MTQAARALLTVAALGVVGALLVWASRSGALYVVRILNVAAINAMLAVSLNIIYGLSGQFSLGHAGFMAIGAYATALLTMSPAQKEANFFITPIVPVLANLSLPFLPSLLVSGLLAAGLALLVGAPVLRLRGDYLGIATLGFAEIVRVVATNLQSVTNGPLGLKGIPENSHLGWTWGWAAATVFVACRLSNSSYGLALRAVRDDEVAAEAMGIGLLYHKLLAFGLGGFFAGVGGGLLAALLGTVDPKTFNFLLTFQILMMVVIGGLGSVSGSVVAAVLYTVLMELLRPIEEPHTFGAIQVPGIPGLRMVLFSVLLLVVILFWRQGLMGHRELSWERLFGSRIRAAATAVEGSRAP